MKSKQFDSIFSLINKLSFIPLKYSGGFMLFILIILMACSNKKAASSTNNNSSTSANSIEVGISAFDATFPLNISDINFEDENNIIHLNDGIIAKIDQTIKNYYDKECETDSLHSYKDTYINTIRLHDSLQTLFLILLKHHPTGAINGKVLFYNNQMKEFANEIFDFNLHALYEGDYGKLNPTNLKTTLNITTPEIELIDFNKDGVNDYKFSRLFHNGTFNSVQTTILSVENSTLDTLYFSG